MAKSFENTVLKVSGFLKTCGLENFVVENKLVVYVTGALNSDTFKKITEAIEKQGLKITSFSLYAIRPYTLQVEFNLET